MDKLNALRRLREGKAHVLHEFGVTELALFGIAGYFFRYERHFV